MGNVGICTRHVTLKTHQNSGCLVIFIQLRYQSDIPNEEKSEEKKLRAQRPSGASPNGPHILARGLNVKKRLNDVICLPMKVV